MSQRERETTIHVAYEDFVPFDPSSPEKSLLRAIVLSALNDLKKPGEVGRRASEYLLSKDDDYIFSFQSICNYLNVDPGKILMVSGLTPPNGDEKTPRGQAVRSEGSARSRSAS